MPVLDLKAASQHVNGQPYLGPITVRIALEGITCVLGPNGAGKSMFLSLCHGMCPADGGVVTWDGLPASETRLSRGYMMQHPVVLRRTVAANIDFPLRAAGHSAAQRKVKTADILATSRLSDKSNTPAAALSGGELRRMALARALVTEPQALILDEPFAGLDPANAAEIEAAIVGIAPSVPVLMSTHDLAQARRIAKRVLFITDGQLAENTTAEAFFNGPDDPRARQFLQGQFL